MEKKLHLYLGEFIIWFSVGLLAFLLTFTFNDEISLYKYGANRWPAALSIFLMIFSLCLFIYQCFFYHKINQDSDDNYKLTLPVMIKVFIPPLIYVFIIPYIGFYIATLIFVPIYSYLIGKSNFFKIVVICTPIVIFLIILFTKFLFVPFPTGTIKLFYTINSEIVSLLY